MLWLKNDPLRSSDSCENSLDVDDVTMASLVHPALTTVSVDRMAFGRLAVELLLSRINAPQRPAVRSTLGVKLVTRASVEAPRRQLLITTLVATES